MIFTCPCQQKITLSRHAFFTGFVCSSCSKVFEPSDLMAYETLGNDSGSDSQCGIAVKPGDVLNGFQIESLLGRGSFGSVFLAKDLVLQRQVALKIPKVVHLDNRHVEVMIREARLVGKLRHPNIVAVHEVHNCDGEIYIVSDFIDGVTLKEMCSVAHFEIEEVVSLISKLAWAIHYAHSHGIIHRDLKPANILIDSFGEPYITDFGIAFHELHSADALADSQVVGTPAYMAPEQAFSDFTKPNSQLDVYSLGALLFELLTGSLPSERQDLASASNGVIALPDELQRICLNAIATDVNDRYATAEKFAEELDRFQENHFEKSLVRLNAMPAVTRRRGLGAPRMGFAVLVGSVLVGCVLLAASYFFETSANNNLKTLNLGPGITTQESNIHLRLKGKSEILDLVNKIEITKADFDVDYGLVKNKVVAECGPNGAVIQRLDSGSYHVVVSSAADGPIHFARRKIAGDVRPCQWEPLELTSLPETDDEEIQLGPNELVKIEGGTFSFGSEHYSKASELLFPFTEQTVQPFYVAKKEVAVSDFQKVMGFIPTGMESRYLDKDVPLDIPVTDVTFEMAEEYCEIIGARLPTLAEYVFLASNFGETKYPWGDQAPGVAKCAAGECVIENDVLRVEPRIEGLYSSALEWTTDINIPYTTGMNTKARQLLLNIARRSRVVVGGTLSELKSGDPERIRMMLGVRAFGSMDTKKSPSSHQGFRVYR